MPLEKDSKLCSSRSRTMETKVGQGKEDPIRVETVVFDKLLRCQRLSTARFLSKVVIHEAESTNPAMPGRHLETALQKVLRRCR
jgi:hypothetical protein